MKGEIRNMTPLPHPILAARQNDREAHNLIALGDVEGHSPSAWTIDGKGKVSLQSLEGFTVIDPTFVPGSIDNLLSFAQGKQTTGQQQGGTFGQRT